MKFQITAATLFEKGNEDYGYEGGIQDDESISMNTLSPERINGQFLEELLNQLKDNHDFKQFINKIGFFKIDEIKESENFKIAESDYIFFIDNYRYFVLNETNFHIYEKARDRTLFIEAVPSNDLKKRIDKIKKKYEEEIAAKKEKKKQKMIEKAKKILEENK